MNSWTEIAIPKNLSEFYYGYELPLARAFFEIEKRGVYTDAERLEELRGFILRDLEGLADTMSDIVGKHVAFSKAHAERLGWPRKEYINLAYPGDIVKILEARGLKVPKDRTTHQKTTAEDALNQLYAETGDEITMQILHAREYTKILGTYVNAKLHNGVLYSSYSVSGTVTGRRSARKNIYGYGTNHQNLPKHSDLGKLFRACIVARPGMILVACDQAQAEDWLVSGLIADIGGDYKGLDELRGGIDRHRKLASLLFRKPESECGKDTPERFFGKKTRHAGNYDMGEEEMARQMVMEGHSVTTDLCRDFLGIFHGDNPGIRGVFHKFVRDQLSFTRTLVTPFGRERVFLGCRPYSDNKKVFKEAFSHIPQSSVGDNTGMAILFCERNEPGYVVMDGHDAVVLEVPDDLEHVLFGTELLDAAFDRQIKLPNGLEIQIPVEFEIGHDLAHMVGYKSTERNAVIEAYGQVGASLVEKG